MNFTGDTWAEALDAQTNVDNRPGCSSSWQWPSVSACRIPWSCPSPAAGADCSSASAHGGAHGAEIAADYPASGLQAGCNSVGPCAASPWFTCSQVWLSPCCAITQKLLRMPQPRVKTHYSRSTAVPKTPACVKACVAFFP